MKKMIYTKELDEQIIFHEDHMLAMYLEKIKEYKPLFEENGVSLKTGLMWSCFPNDTAGFQRTPFQNGYQCYVYCTVLKDGKEVQIDSADGEADYYPLSAQWMISSVFRSFFKLHVTLYEDTDDPETDLNWFLAQLRRAG